MFLAAAVRRLTAVTPGQVMVAPDVAVGKLSLDTTTRTLAQSGVRAAVAAA